MKLKLGSIAVVAALSVTLAFSAPTSANAAPECIATSNVSLPNCDFTNSTQNWFNGIFDNSNFSHSNLSGIESRWSFWISTNLTGANLSESNLHGAFLQATNFTSANLINADLTGTNIADAVFTGAKLTGIRSGGVAGTPADLPVGWSIRGGYIFGPYADLSGANLSGLDFTGVDLSAANLDGVRSGGITGTPAALPKDWRLIEGFLIGPKADLRGAKLDNLDIWFGNFTDVNLEGASIDGTAFLNCTGIKGLKTGKLAGVPQTAVGTLVNGYFIAEGVNLEGADLQGANLSGLGFRNSNLRSADFTGANLQLADFGGSTVVNTDFTGANLQSADFGGSTVVNTDFTGANLTLANLSRSTINQSRFNGSNLTEAKFWYNIISSTEFHGANLTEAEFPEAVLSDSRSSGIIGGPRMTGNFMVSGGVILQEQPSDTFEVSVIGEASADNFLFADVNRSSNSATLKYQWFRGDIKVLGATDSYYQVTGADQYAAIRVDVTAEKPGFISRFQSSLDVMVFNRYMAKGKVFVYGTAKVGSSLSADVNTWVDKAKISYKWLRAGKAIKGATKSTYRLVAADKGKSVSVMVTQSAKGYYNGEKTSTTLKIK